MLKIQRLTVPITHKLNIVCMSTRHITLLWRTGELSANHVSCLSVWQWAKHEFMNNPFWRDVANCLITFSIWFLNPVPKKLKRKFVTVSRQDYMLRLETIHYVQVAMMRQDLVVLWKQVVHEIYEIITLEK